VKLVSATSSLNSCSVSFCFNRQRELFQVLKAYSILNTSIGYCQAQAPLAAFLLMHMPAEQAFWCLVSICDKYLAGYYSQGMVSLFVGVLLLVLFFFGGGGGCLLL
jgi:hypothetical protein